MQAEPNAQRDPLPKPSLFERMWNAGGGSDADMSAGYSMHPLAKFEFVVVQAAVLLAPYIAFRHPAIFITISDCLFLLALILRVVSGFPSAPFGSATWLWILGVLMMTGGMMIGSLINGDPMRGLIVNAQYYFAFICLPFVVMCRPMPQAVRLLKCGVMSMSIMCAIGIAVYASDHVGTGSRHMAIVTGNRRLSGFVDNPNKMAVYIVITFPLLWFSYLAGEMKRLTALICLSVLLVGVILTSSNTGVFGTVAASLVFFGSRGNYKTLIITATLAYSGLIWGHAYLPQTFQERVSGAIESGDISEAGTYESRRMLEVEALAMSSNHVLIGLGADQYREVSKYGLPVHNIYLLLLNEGGALSLFGWFTILASAMITPVVARGRPYGNLVTLTTVTIVVVLASMAMGVAHVYARSVILPVLLAIGPAVAWTSDGAVAAPKRRKNLPLRVTGRSA